MHPLEKTNFDASYSESDGVAFPLKRAAQVAISVVVVSNIQSFAIRLERASCTLVWLR